MRKTFILKRTPIEGWELSKAVVGTSYSGEEANDEYKITNAIAESEDGLTFTLYYKKKATITVNNQKKQYDGTALTLPATLQDQVTVTGLRDSDKLDSISYTYTDADTADEKGRINVGVTTVTPANAQIRGTFTNSNYYSIRYISGTLEVTTVNVTIRIEPDRWTGIVYDGKEYKAGFSNSTKPNIADYVIISNDGYKDKYLNEIWNKVISLDNVIEDSGVPGLHHYVEAKKDAGDYTYNIAFTPDMLPVNSNYSVNLYVRPGRLQILPKEVTVNTGSGEKPYDGSALTNPEASITGLVGSDERIVIVSATGSQTEIGSSSNTYSIEWGTVNSQNYAVTENLGTLTVTGNSESEVTLTAASASKTYNGTALTNSNVTAAGLPDGFTVEAAASGSQTNVGASKNVVNDNYVIKNAAGVDKTANFTNVKKADGTLTVNPAPVTITTGSGSKVYDGTPLTNAEASITGLVNGETASVKATGTQTEVGSSDNTYSIDWGETDAGNYTVTENLGSLTVTAIAGEVVLTAASGSKTYDGNALTDNTVTASGLPEGFTVVATATGSQTDAGSSKNVVNDGYVIKNTKGEDKTNYFTNVQKVDGNLTVNPAAVTITTGSDSKRYDGAPLTKTDATITGLVNNETATVTATGSQTEVGSSDNTYRIDWGTAKKNNYELTENLGTLTVTESDVEVTLTAATDQKTYDGTALTNASVTASGLPEGFTVVATATGSQTDAGSSANIVNDGYVIKNSKGEDKTANFTNVTKANGTLTVNPAAVTITTGSDSKQYDGAPLTNAEATIEGLVNNETAAVTATGSQTEVGSSNNTYSIEWGETNANNYTVTEELGTLTVTTNSATVTLIAADNSKTYDGTALTNDDVTASGLPAGFTVEATASGSQTDVGEGANVVNDGYVIKNAEGEDKTANFTTVKKKDGKLTVNPKAVTITTGSASKAYDGTPLTKEEASIEGLVEGESVTLKATGTITEVGSKDNTYSITWDNAKEKNYTVTENLGTLTITASDVDVVLTAASDSKTYDGTALTNGDVTANGLPAGFTVEATASGSQTDVGEGENVVNDGYIIRNAEGEDRTASFTNVEKVAGTLTVNPAPVTVTTGSDTKSYDGTPLMKDEATIEGLVAAEAELVTIKATGSQTEVGSSDNTYEITWGDVKGTNYTITENLGTLEVTKNTSEVTLTAGSATKVYDGTELTNSEVTAAGLPEGFTVDAVTIGSQTDVGEAVNVVKDGFVIKNSAGEDKTANFTVIVTVSGSLTVTPKMVTVKTESASKMYDGTPLTNDKAEILGLVGNDSATVTVIGTITDVGSVDNEYSAIVWAPDTKADNYSVTSDLGKLTITPNEKQITVKIIGKTNSVVYNGKEQFVSGYEIQIQDPVPGFSEANVKLNGTATAKGTNVKQDENDSKYYMGLTAEQFENTNARNIPNVVFEVTDGYLEITPAPVTVKADDKTKLTDAVDPELTATVTGLIGDDKVAYELTREKGETVGAYKIIPTGERSQGNYIVTYEEGTLQITKRPTILIAAKDAEKIYDGEVVTDEELKKLITVTMPEGYNVSDYTFEYTLADGKTVKDVGKYTIITGVVVRAKDGSVVATYDGSNKNETKAAKLLKDAGSEILRSVTFTPMVVYADEDNRLDLIVTPGTYTITRREVTVTADSVVRTQNEKDPAFTASLENVVAGEEKLIKYSISRKSDSNSVGTLTDEIVPSGDAIQGNYTVKFVAGDLTINSNGGGGTPSGGGGGRRSRPERSQTVTPPTTPGEVLGVTREVAEDTGRGVLGAVRNQQPSVLGAVRTGDSSTMVTWAVIMMLAMSGIIAWLNMYRRRKRNI